MFRGYCGVEWLITALLSTFLTLLGFFVLLKRFGSNIGEALTGTVQQFSDLFVQPNVKRAFSNMGKLGGDAKAQGEINNKIAMGYINKNMGLFKMLGEKFLGLDVEELLEEYGPMNVIRAVKEAGDTMGFDISDLQNFDFKKLLSGKGSTPKSKPSSSLNIA